MSIIILRRVHATLRDLCSPLPSVARCHGEAFDKASLTEEASCATGRLTHNQRGFYSDTPAAEFLEFQLYTWRLKIQEDAEKPSRQSN